MNIDEVYNQRTRKIMVAIKDYLRLPKEFGHGVDVLIARIPNQPDGFEVEVYESRWPATAWKLRALPTPNSMNSPRPGFELSTGTGDECGRLIAEIALQVAGGMLSAKVFHPDYAAEFDRGPHGAAVERSRENSVGCNDRSEGDE